MDSKSKEYYLSYEKRRNLGTLLLLNSPKKMQFGIDLSQWVIGDKFMGIKLIPIGVHYISFSLSEENNAFKQGFFIEIEDNKKKSKNIIREWSPKYETFIKLNDEMDKNYSIGLDNLDFDQFLGNYPYEQIQNWTDLSKFLNTSVINRLQKNIDMTMCPEIKEDKNNEQENENKNNMQIMSYDNIEFTEFYLNQPEYINSLDKSALLEKILSKFKSPNEFLGEFQYTFILFLIGEVYEALKQWKDIFILITSSEDLINKKNFEKFFCDFIEIIYNQLRLFPDDLMHDVILDNNFLKRYLTNFLLFEKKEMKNFSKRQKLLKAFVEEKFGYKIKSEEERIIENYLNKDKNKKDKNDYYELYKDEINDDLPVIVDEMDNFAI
jgi:A1 cistron-splicing factor AAR2